MPEREAGPWGEVLRSATRLQELVPDAILVGGTAAALHAGHRVSFDHDHLLADLRERFDGMLTALEETEGWVTALAPARADPRQSGRGGDRPPAADPHAAPERAVADGLTVRVPTLDEMLRVKAWLVVRRNATRDYLDVAALADRIGTGPAARVLVEIDAYYDAVDAPASRPVATQLARQLAEPVPYDLDRVELRAYRGLHVRWQDWESVAAACGELATAVLALTAGRGHGAG